MYFREAFSFCKKNNITKLCKPIKVMTAFHGEIDVELYECKITGIECSSTKCPIKGASNEKD